LQAAKKALAAATLAAKSSFQLWVADAKANRDQALMAAGKDKQAIAAAHSQFQAQLGIAKKAFDAAVSAAGVAFAGALASAGIPNRNK
jgi:hypothetical protein